jgi:hypothetical protein
MGQFEPDEILAMSGVHHLFDAYVIGLFARIWNDHHVCTVRLASDEFPDGQLCDDHGTHNLEATMADQKDRRMAEEHRSWRERRERGEIVAIPVDMNREREYALEAVPRVCRRKVVKYLGSEASTRQVPAALVIYVNFSTVTPALSDEDMIHLTEPWKANFTAIWLLSGTRIFRAWPSELDLRALSDPLV